MLRCDSSGFSLIELLIVLLIVALVGGLVSPRLYHAYEKMAAVSEERRLEEIIQMARERAFYRQTPITLHLEGNRIELGKEKNAVHFTHLRFPVDTVSYNGNGFSDKPTVSYYIGEQRKQMRALAAPLTPPHADKQ